MALRSIVIIPRILVPNSTSYQAVTEEINFVHGIAKGPVVVLTSDNHGCIPKVDVDDSMINKLYLVDIEFSAGELIAFCKEHKPRIITWISSNPDKGRVKQQIENIVTKYNPLVTLNKTKVTPGSTRLELVLDPIPTLPPVHAYR